MPIPTKVANNNPQFHSSISTAAKEQQNQPKTFLERPLHQSLPNTLLNCVLLVVASKKTMCFHHQDVFATNFPLDYVANDPPFYPNSEKSRDASYLASLTE
jgi:hypothetical protein